MEDDMIFPSFDVDIEGIVDILNKEGYERILLQGPEGMKRGLMDLADLLEERTGSTIWIDGEPCYGSCDHAGERARILGSDALIHLGHADIPSMEREGSVPIHFFHVKMRVNEEILKRGLPEIIDRIDEGRTALFTTVQHLNLLPVVSELLKSEGRDVFIGEPGGREMFPGQVLGCSFQPAKNLPDDVSSLLFIGTGKFHPLGLCMESGKEVHTIDPMTGETHVISQGDLENILRGRFGHMNRARELIELDETIGIIVGFKPGQRRLALSEEIGDLLDRKERKGKIVIMDHMDPMKLRSLGLKVAVSTSCPRIVLDDSSRYSMEGVMLLTPVELRIVLGEVSWDDYRFDDEW